MKVAYLAGQYSADDAEQVRANVEAAAAVQHELLNIRLAVFCPHVNYGHTHVAAFHYEQVMDFCFAHLRRTDLVVMLPGWQQSHGACREHGFATALGLPIYYWPADREKIIAAAAPPVLP